MARRDEGRDGAAKPGPEPITTWEIHEVDGDEALVLETEQVRAILEVIEWLNQ